jgi:hypothetical protein
LLGPNNEQAHYTDQQELGEADIKHVPVPSLAGGFFSIAVVLWAAWSSGV